MEKEISGGAMFGIVLIALAAIVGLGFGVFAIAKGTVSQGVTSVQSNLGSVNDSAYAEYDQTVVTGTQVNGAFQTFNNKSVAILVATQATIDQCGSSLGSNTFVSGGADVASTYKSTSIPAVEVLSAVNTTTAMAVTNSAGATADLEFINYNTLIGGTTPTVAFDSTCYRDSNGLLKVGNTDAQNSIDANISKSNAMEYIPFQGEFQAYLVKDLSGTVLGVSFEQVTSYN